MAKVLARKVAVTLLLILVCTVAITSFFTYSRLHSVLSSLVESRYGVQLYSVKNDVEARLGLGFPLRQLRVVQDSIDREKLNDPAILDIEVFDARGEILFDTDRGAIGTLVPAEWLKSAAAGGALFSHPDDDARAVGLPLANSLGEVTGGVTLRYPAAYLDNELAPMIGDLARVGLLLLGAAALVAMLGSHVLFRPVARRLTAMEAVLEAPPEEHFAALDADASLEERFDAFAAKAREAMDHMREASEDVERLDRLG